MILEILDIEVLIEDIKCHRSDKFLTVEEYVMWTVNNDISLDFLNLIFQVKLTLTKNHKLYEYRYYITNYFIGLGVPYCLRFKTSFAPRRA